MTETFCDSGAVKLKAGANATTALTPANYTQFINQAESFINSVIREDFVATYSGLSDAKKKIIEDAASSHAAMAVINYDMSGYTSRTEAQTMLDVNWARLQEALKLLKTKEVTKFIG